MERRAKLTRQLTFKIQELWDDVSALPIPEEEKLDSCFEKIPVSLFPPTIHGEVIEVTSDTSIAEAVQILAENNIMSVPVRDVTAPDNASWIDKYLGISEFAGIAYWVLHQSEIAAQELMAGSGASGTEVGTRGAYNGVRTDIDASDEALASEEGMGATATSSQFQSDPEVMPAMGTNFFEALTSSDVYTNTKVKDIAGSFRWAPFLPVQNSDNLLTLLLLLSRYRVKSLPVVESGEGKIENMITQTAVVHILSQCSGHAWFERLGKKTLSELQLPRIKSDQIVKVDENRPVLEAFQLMKEKGLGGIPVVTEEGNLVGNISVRDVQFLLTAPKIYSNYRSIRVKDFLEATRNYLAERNSNAPLLHSVITCKCDDPVEDVIMKLDRHKIHRIYILDDEDCLKGLVTLRDLISEFVVEPPEYFGEFFAGWLPAYSP